MRKQVQIKLVNEEAKEFLVLQDNLKMKRPELIRYLMRYYLDNKK